MTQIGALRRSLVGVAAVACVALWAVAAPAGAAARVSRGPSAAAASASGLYLTGAGFGHGVGMSQYGAAGYALHGYTYAQILRAYYAQTTIGHVSLRRRVTVLLKPSGGARFTGATAIKGLHVALSPKATYSVRAVGQQLRLTSAGVVVGLFNAPLTVTGSAPLTLVGTGVYRGAFEFSPSPTGGVMTINSVRVDDYVRGVVAAEMPAGWPAQALEAQAVAARTYAISAGAVASDFSLYSDTRSQMYGGVAAETPASNAAVAATAGQVVDYDGTPATTYFFASSGGETESVQNVFAGVTPEAWLVSQSDPYDDSFSNPYYRWSLQFSLRAAASRLGKLLDGSLEGIKVLSRGVSPRIVQAQIVGTRGRTEVSGDELEAALGTPSTWMTLTTITAAGTHAKPPPPPAAPTTPATTTTAATLTAPASTSTTTSTPAPTSTGTATDTTTSTTPTQTATTQTATTQTATSPTTSTPVPASPDGGSPTASASRARASRAGGTGDRGSVASAAGVGVLYAVTGTIFPAQAGAPVVVQRRRRPGLWVRVGVGFERPSGAYSVSVPAPGAYRVLYGSVIGPEVNVR